MLLNLNWRPFKRTHFRKHIDSVCRCWVNKFQYMVIWLMKFSLFSWMSSSSATAGAWSSTLVFIAMNSIALARCTHALSLSRSQNWWLLSLWHKRVAFRKSFLIQNFKMPSYIRPQTKRIRFASAKWNVMKRWMRGGGRLKINFQCGMNR